MPYQPIENYGVIGNLRTAALVGMDGSIDWLCLPTLRLAERLRRHPRRPQGRPLPHRPGRQTTSGTSSSTGRTPHILVTRFLHADGVGEVEDYMPVGGTGAVPDELIRRVRVVRGRMPFRLECRPAFDYARGRSRDATWSEHGARFDGPGLSLGLAAPHAAAAATARASSPTSRSGKGRTPRSSCAASLPTTSPAAAPESARRRSCSATPSPTGGAGSRGAPTPAAGGRWSTARPSRSSSCPSSRPGRSSRPRPAACPSRSAARGTGTTATPGSATPRSRSTACSASASPRRRPASGTG